MMSHSTLSIQWVLRHREQRPLIHYLSIHPGISLQTIYSSRRSHMMGGRWMMTDSTLSWGWTRQSRRRGGLRSWLGIMIMRRHFTRQSSHEQELWRVSSPMFNLDYIGILQPNAQPSTGRLRIRRKPSTNSRVSEKDSRFLKTMKLNWNTEFKDL